MNKHTQIIFVGMSKNCFSTLEKNLKFFGEFSGGLVERPPEDFLRLFGEFLAALENGPRESFRRVLVKLLMNENLAAMSITE